MNDVRLALDSTQQIPALVPSFFLMEVFYCGEDLEIHLIWIRVKKSALFSCLEEIAIILAT